MRRPYADYRSQGWDVAARTGRKKCLSLLDGSVHRRNRSSGWRRCFWSVIAIRCHRTFPAARCKRSNQTHQFRPRHHQAHLVQKHAFVRPLGDQFKSGGGRADLIHKRSVAQSAFCALGFANLPWLDAVAATLNARPRKILGWKTLAEAFNALLSDAQLTGVATTG